MRRYLWCALAAFACGPASRGPVGEGLGTITHYDTRSIRYLTVEDSVRFGLLRLYWDAQAESLETIACLYGHREDKDVTVTSYRLGHMRLRGPHMVMFDAGTSGCPEGEGLVGTFHTHLLSALGINRSPSTPDRMSFFGDPRVIVMFVGVGPDPNLPHSLLVYWTLRHGNQGYLNWP